MEKSTVIKVLETPADSMELAIKSFQRFNESRGLSKDSINHYRGMLQAFYNYVGNVLPGSITSDIIREFMSDKLKINSNQTVKLYYIALSVFFKFLLNDGLIEKSPMVNISKPKVRRTVINTFSVSDIKKLFIGCNTKSFIGVRDKALIMIMIDCALRASEVCNIKLGDIDWGNNTILVLGKGNKERLVPFGHSARRCLNAYLVKRGKQDTDNLFVTQFMENFDRRLLFQMIKNRCIKAGIENVRCSPHTFRHTSAVTFLRNGGDVFSLQKILGHSTLDMTRHYAELSNTDVIDKHRLYSPGDSLMPKETTGRKRLK